MANLPDSKPGSSGSSPGSPATLPLSSCTHEPKRPRLEAMVGPAERVSITMCDECFEKIKPLILCGGFQGRKTISIEAVPFTKSDAPS